MDFGEVHSQVKYQDYPIQTGAIKYAFGPGSIQVWLLGIPHIDMSELSRIFSNGYKYIDRTKD